MHYSVSTRLGFLSAQGLCQPGVSISPGSLSARGLYQPGNPEIPWSQDLMIGTVNTSNLSKKNEHVKCIKDRELCFT